MPLSRSPGRPSTGGGALDPASPEHWDDQGAGERGSATAEFAVVLPAVMALAVVLLTVARAALLPVALADASADAARLEGRGESGAAAARISSVAPGASMSVTRSTALVCVEAQAPISVAGLGGLGDARARGCALDDVTSGGGAP